MHPEYPCAHCIVSGAVGAVLQAEIARHGGKVPLLRTTSRAAGNAEQSWKTFNEFTQEVANACIYDGAHYRNSVEIGTAMGKQIGGLAVAKFFTPGKE